MEIMDSRKSKCCQQLTRYTDAGTQKPPQRVLVVKLQRPGTASSAADYIKKSQAQNYESWRAQYESYEVNKAKTDGTASTGFVDWMLTSGWFSLHWQVFDWYLRPSAAYFGVKKSGEPLHISWDYGFKNNVNVTNDL